MNTLWCDSGSTHRRSMMDQRKTNGEYEKTRVDCCTALGVAGRGAITTTAAGCRRPDKHIATPNTGVICQEEIAATFCNVPTSPSHRGYRSTAVSGAASGSGGGAGSITPSIPLCSAFPPANELCN